MATSRQAASLWDRADISYKNYVAYIERRRDRLRLTLIDLLHVRNFKGGNASVHVPEDGLTPMLRSWSRHLRRLADLFDGQELRELPRTSVARLQKETTAFLQLADSDSDAKILGFGVAHASVLVHARFPELLPILDSRVLKGSGIVRKRRRATPDDYPLLIAQCRKELLKDRKLRMRELDRKWFIRK